MTEQPVNTVDSELLFIAFDESLIGLPDPNGSAAMVGEVLADDWTPDGDR